MSRKTIVMVVTVMVIVAIVIVGVYLVTRDGGGTKNTYTVANATSLQIEDNGSFQETKVDHSRCWDRL